jgi:hypothetical protein
MDRDDTWSVDRCTKSSRDESIDRIDGLNKLIINIRRETSRSIESIDGLNSLTKRDETIGRSHHAPIALTMSPPRLTAYGSASIPVPMQTFISVATVAPNPPSSKPPSSLRSLGRTGASKLPPPIPAPAEEEDDSRCRIRMAAPLWRGEDGERAMSLGRSMWGGSDADERRGCGRPGVSSSSAGNIFEPSPCRSMGGDSVSGNERAHSRFFVSLGWLLGACARRPATSSSSDDFFFV